MIFVWLDKFWFGWTLNRICRADVNNNAKKSTKTYFGLRDHSKNFNHEQYGKSTKLSKYVWLLKELQKMSSIKYSIAERVYGQIKIIFCPLCLAEKVHLIEHCNYSWLLNKKNQFISRCIPQVKLFLQRFKRK